MKLFFHKNALILTRIAAFLAVLLLFVNYYLLLILNNFFSAVPGGFIAMISLFSFLGVALGAFICPFFMSYSEKPLKSILFILVILVPNLIIRAIGVDLWASSLIARFFIHVLSGMLYPVCLGLFLQTCLDNSSCAENRTGKYGMFFFAIAVVGGIIIRHIYLSILEKINAAQAINFTYNFINILIFLIGCFVIVCILLQKKPAAESSVKTNWSVILRLFALAVVFRVLNSFMEMRLFPRLAYSENTLDIHQIIMVIAIPVFALLAGRCIKRFLKYFITAAISIFILIPCLLFFNEYPNFILFMEILVGLLNNLIWVVFTFAIIEHYSGGFWFYALASSIHFTTLFSMISPMTKQLIPAGTEFTILICGIAAVLFVFLGIRIVFPKNQPSIITNKTLFSDIFREYKLTDSEAEVASLVMEGLKNEEIAKRLFRAAITVRVHLVSVYKKFKVKNRAEFMALLMKKHQII